MMTTFIWTGHLPAFKHMKDLRIDAHAQKEAQYFANELDKLMNLHPYQKEWSSNNELLKKVI
jgi:thymidylate synthase ThyX